MPESPRDDGSLVLRWDQATLTLDRRGRVTSLVHDQWGPYLDRWELLEATDGPQDVDLVMADQDEVEVHLRRPGTATTIRHGVLGPGEVGPWSVRIAVENTSGTRAHHAPQVIAVPARGCAGWMWSAGAQAAWVIAPGAGAVSESSSGAQAPLLVVWQRAGATRDTDRMVLGPDEPWRPGERRIWQWNASWVHDFRAVADVLPRWWPPATYLPAGEPLEVSDMDLAVEEDPADDLEVLGSDTGSQVLPAGERCRHVVRLHGPAGTSLVDTRWAPTTHAVVQRWATRIITDHGQAPGAGRQALTVEEAALVLAVLAGPGMPDPMTALDVVESAMADLLDGPASGALVLACLGLHDALGEQAWLDHALHVMAELAAGPLAATAGLNLLAACVTAGRSPAGVAEPLSRLAAQAVRGYDEDGIEIDVAVRAEFALVTSAGRWDHRIREAAAWAGARLGGGMPGVPMPTMPPEDMARLVLMLTHADESGARELTRTWVCSPGELAEHTRRGLLAELSDHDPLGGPAEAARILLPLLLAQSW